MSNIEERIVKLSFDNQNFEQNVSKTLQSLEKLNQVLNNTGNATAVNQLSKSMKDIKTQLNGFNLDELEKMTTKESTWTKIGNAMSNVGKGIGNAMSKLKIGDSISKLSSSFSDAVGGSKSLENSVSSVTKGFSALEVVAASALATITNKAVNTGMSVVKSLTVDPIKTGLSEYETKMNSMQTIYANTSHKGTTYDDIVKALDELNTYSDKTIYNFAQMTDNIGKFTSAGVDLDKSVSSIKGLANVAAMSGVDNARAAGVMYQASQAMAKGYFQLMDWRSFSNNGMGNERFRNALIDMSEVMGTGAKAAIKAAGSFDESLSKSKWLTADVMAETLAVLAGTYDKAALLSKGFSEEQAKAMLALAKDAENAATEIRTISQLFDTMKENVQSGWAKSWEWIIGDKEQATKLLTGVSKAFENIVTPIADARNAMLQFWNENGGRDAVISGLGNVFSSLGKILGTVRDAFREVFPPLTGEKLVDISKKFEKFTEKLKVSDKVIGKIKDTFKGLFSGVDFLGSFTKVFAGFKPLLSLMPTIGNAILSVTGAIGNLMTSITGYFSSSGLFTSMESTVSRITAAFANIINNVSKSVTTVINAMGKLNFKPMMEAFGKIGGSLGNGFVAILEGIGKAVGTINFGVIFSALSAMAGKDAFGKLKSIFDDLAASIKNITGLPTKISGLLSAVRTSLEAYQNNLHAGTLLKIAGAIGVLAASLLLLSTIQPDKLQTGLAGLGTILVGVVAGMAGLMILTSKHKMAFMSLNGIALALLSFGATLILMAAALRVIASTDMEGVAKGIVGLAASIGLMVAAVKGLSGKHKHLGKTASGLLVLSMALLIMSAAVRSFGGMNLASLGTGLLGIAGSLAVIIGFMKLLGNSSMSVTSSVGILILAMALSALQAAVAAFAGMDISNIAQGLGAMTGVLGIIAAFSHLASSGTKMLMVASSMIILSGALYLLSGTLKSFGNMQWDEIARGLTGMAGALLIIGVAVKAISGINMAVTGAGLLIFSNALIVMGNALKNVGGMSWGEIGKGLAALAGGLLVVGVAMAAMSGGLVGAASMLVMAAALKVFIPLLISLSQLSWMQVAIGLTALAGAFTVLGIAGLVLTPVIPSLLLLAAAITLLGVGCLAAGAGVSMFATGLALLAAVGAGGLFGLTEAIRNLLNLLPLLGKKIGEMIVSFAKVMGESVPALAQGIGGLFTGILTAIRDNLPLIITVFAELITALCKALADGIPQMIDAGIKLITGLLDGISKNMIDLVSAGAELVINFLDGISKNIAPVVEAGINLTISFIEGLATGIEENSDRFASAVEHLITAVCNSAASLGTALFTGVGNSSIGGLIAGFASKVGSFLSTVGQCISNAYNTARSKISAFLSTGREYITNLITGIKNKASAAVQAVRSICEQVVSAAKAKASALVSAGRSMIEGFVSGIKEKAASVAEAARSVVEKAVSAAKSALKINSPSKVFIQIGKWTSEGMAIGIEKNTSMVSNASEAMATSAITNVKSAMSRISDAINSDIDSNPTITPVMDLSNVQAGSRLINGMLGGVSSVGLNTSIAGRMVGGIGTIQNGSNNTDVVDALKDLQKTIANKTGDTYNVNGITYDDGSNIVNAVQTLVRATKIERRM